MVRRKKSATSGSTFVKPGNTLVSILVLGAIVMLVMGAYFIGKGETKNSPSPNPTTLPISNWQSYAAPELGYTFKYPSDWATYVLSDTLAVGPQNAIDDLRKLDQRAQGYDSPYLVMQIDVLLTQQLEGSYRSDDYQRVTAEPVTLAGIKATKYTKTYIQSLPGIDIGTKTVSYVIPLGSRVVGIHLLDLRYEPVMEQIVSTFTFNANSSLIGKTLAEVKTTKGSPTDIAKNSKTGKEVWVYTTSGDDSSATYVYFSNGNVAKTRVDEYNGDLGSDTWLK